MDDKKHQNSSERFGQYSLPSPLELAKLAALLDGPDQLCRNTPETALVIALRLYVKAVHCFEHFSSMGGEDLLLTLASTPLQNRSGLQSDEAIMEIYNHIMAKQETLRLYPDRARLSAAEREESFKDGVDEVRTYLMEHAHIYDWKTERVVRDTILRYWKDTAREHNKMHERTITNYQREFEVLYERELRKFAESEGKNHSDLSDHDKGRVRRYTAHRYGRPRENEQTQTGRKLNQGFMDGCARFGDESTGKNQTSRAAYWELPIPFLDKLITWRRKFTKQTGGLKRLDRLE